MPVEGFKTDTGKPRWDLLPVVAVGSIVAVLTAGLVKYPPHNWRTVPEWRDRYFAALLRHLMAWRQGEFSDPETGLPHLAHAGCCLLFLLELELQKSIQERPPAG